MSTRSPMILVVAMMIGLLFPALAAADVEPNDHIYEAEGPVGPVVVGNTDASGSSDFYVFYVAGQQQLHVSAVSTTGKDCLRVSLYGPNGGSTLSKDYTTPDGTTRFFVEVSQYSYASSDCTRSPGYQLSIQPGAALVQGPPMDVPIATGEPNELFSQPFGPILGGVSYLGAQETTNDQDWFQVFVAPGTQQLDISGIARTNTATNSCSGGSLTLFDSTGTDDLDSLYVDSTYAFDHINYTATGPTTLYLREQGRCVGSRYQFRVDPPGAVTDTLQVVAPPPSTAPGTAARPGLSPEAKCLNARTAITRLRVAIHRLSHRHHLSRTQRTKLRKNRASLKSAYRARRSNC